MYLRQGSDGLPMLNIINHESEYPLIKHWATHFPLEKFNSVYKLDAEAKKAWWEHFYAFVYLRASSGQVIVPAKLERNTELFYTWIHSGDSDSVWNTNLKKFIDDPLNIMPVSMLIPDVFCCDCEHEEPFFVHYGTNERPAAWAPEYRHLKEVLNYPLFEVFPEVSTCIACDPRNRVITPWMSLVSRFRQDQCRCQPCRGGL